MDVGEALEDIRELGSFKNWALERATGDIGKHCCLGRVVWWILTPPK